jgi:hypothetical protein
MARPARFDRESAGDVISECCDGLLWIGQSYAWIDCGRETSCAIPDPGILGEHCFVHEAEWRGVSRKIAAPPPWVVPGLTRVFLAHRGDQRRSDLGRLFGYFVLGRVEQLTAAAPVELPQQDVAARGLSSRSRGALEVRVIHSGTGRPVSRATVTARPEAPGAREVTPLALSKDGRFRTELEPGGYDLGVSAEGFEPALVQGVRITGCRACKQDVIVKPTEPDLREPEQKERTRKCPDGTTITTHIWRGGEWVRTDERCEEDDDEPGCEEGSFRLDFCPEGVIVSAVCMDGEWRPTGARCRKDAPVEDEVLAEERSCSLRLRPGAVYLVDSLAAEIHDRFRAALSGTDLRARYRRAANTNARAAVAQEGRDLFNSTAAWVRGQRAVDGVAPCVPRCLQDKTIVRGDLVQLIDPPVVERRPRASFRSLARIDGDCLIRQIANGEPKARLRLYAARAKGAGMTWADVAAALAERCGTNTATAHAVLTALAALAREELQRDVESSFRLQHLGTFRWRTSRGQPRHLVFDLAEAMRRLPCPPPPPKPVEGC